MSKFTEEFKEFINQGSIMDLAVGVVIGTAFGKIVNSLVSDIIMPSVGVLLGGVDFSNLAIDIPSPTGETAAHIAYGSFIQTAVDFFIIALAVFLFVRAINRMNRRAKAAVEKVAKKSDKPSSKAKK